MLLDATFTGTTRADCVSGGACWVFVKARFGQFMYGLYPPTERWRVDLAGAILVVSVAALSWKALPWRRALRGRGLHRAAAARRLAARRRLRPAPTVETREWGGLMLTIFISIYAGLIAIPLGILLALGRQSRLPVIRMISVIFIEFWRGVPIVAVIFLASILLPLIMPSGVGVDRLARAVIGLGLRDRRLHGGSRARRIAGGARRASTKPRPRSASATGARPASSCCRRPSASRFPR